MYATLRRLRCHPGRAEEVGRLIEAEYVPQLADVEGVVSYTLVAVGDDEVTSMGLFTTRPSADAANALAQTWAKDRLVEQGAAPLEATAGDVLVHATFSR